VRDAFRVAVDSVLAHAREFCFDLEHRGETATVFDVQAWVGERADVEDADQPFLAMLAETQAFSLFLGESSSAARP
jgi:hypothetical protein